MEKIKSFLVTLAGIAVVGLVFTAFIQTSQQVSLSGSERRCSGGSSVQRSITDTVSQILGASSNRCGFKIVSHSSTTQVYCLMDDVAAGSSLVTSTVGGERGFPIPRNVSSTSQDASYENTWYVGAINCTAQAAVSSTVMFW